MILFKEENWQYLMEVSLIINNHLFNIIIIFNSDFEADASSYTSTEPAAYTYPSSWGGFGISLIKYSSSNWQPPTNTGSGTFLAALQSVLGSMTQTVSVPANTNFAIQFDFCQRNYGYVPNVKVYCNAPSNAGNNTIYRANFLNNNTYFNSCLF